MTNKEPVAWMDPRETFACDAFIWSADPDCHPECSTPVYDLSGVEPVAWLHCWKRPGKCITWASVKQDDFPNEPGWETPLEVTVTPLILKPRDTLPSCPACKARVCSAHRNQDGK